MTMTNGYRVDRVRNGMYIVPRERFMRLTEKMAFRYLDEFLSIMCAHTNPRGQFLDI